MSVTERLLDALRGSVGSAPLPRPSSLDVATLFSAHDRGARAARAAQSACQAVGATLAQQRTALDAAADHARLLLTRGRDVRSGAAQVREALERIKLLALNAGLEGSRLGDPAGKPLVAVADEVRALVTRSLDTLDEHVSLLGDVERERERLRDEVENARQRAGSVAEEILRAQGAHREVDTAMRDLGQGLERATGSNPDTARALTEAAEHARGLLDALGKLSSRAQRGFVLRALGPTLRPLLRLVRDLDGTSHEGDST